MTEAEKKMKKIEEDKELSPRSKRALKEKARIEDLLRRLEVVIKHKEVHDKLTPRESSVFSFSQEGNPNRSMCGFEDLIYLNNLSQKQLSKVS